MKHDAELSAVPLFLTVKDIASILGVSYTKAINVVKYGDMPYIKIGRAFRIPKQGFIKWLDAEKRRVIETS